MQPKDYILDRIEGEYAYIQDENGEELFIAMYLLPPNTDVGSKLHYEMLTEFGASPIHRLSFLKKFFGEK